MTKPRITLPAEKDGVLPDGAVINATPDSPTNPQSCWTRPVDPPIPGIDSNFASGLCQVCVIQNSTDAEASYPSSFEIWVRDDDNHAIGGAGPLALSPLDGRPGAPYYINFTTAGKPFNMWSQLAAEDPKYFCGEHGMEHTTSGQPKGYIGNAIQLLPGSENPDCHVW